MAQTAVISCFVLDVCTFWPAIPAVMLLLSYVGVRTYLRRGLSQNSVVVRYAPPQGLSAAALRYLETGGTDGVSIAAILASLSVKNYIEAQPGPRGAYRFKRLGKCDTELDGLAKEEAEVARLLFDRNSNVGGASTAAGAVLSRVHKDVVAAVRGVSVAPEQALRWNTSIELVTNDARINVLVGTVQSVLRPQLDGKYFTWNFRFIAVGMMATLLYGLTHAAQFKSVFLVVWSFLFLQIFGSVIAMTFPASSRKPAQLIMISAVFATFTGIALGAVAKDASWLPMLAYVTMIVLNSIFIPLLRTPTASGRELQQQITGYKQFLKTAEQDRLNALAMVTAPPPDIETLPYAIALDVKEAWGDAMADAFCGATIAR